MSDLAPRRFEFGLPAVCQQPFTHDGKDYKPGDSFPYDKLGLARWQVQGFWLSSRIDFLPEGMEVFHASPGEHVAVTPPTSKPKHDKRAGR